MAHRKFQTALGVIFPPRCISCGALVDTDFQLCGTCWGQTPFITGTACDSCGQPMPGQDDGGLMQCDDCLKTPRPWAAGRSVFLYKDQGKRLILNLKHGHRLEVARAAASWLERAAQPLLTAETLIAPVPLHWTRLFHRTFNQSAALGAAMANISGHEFCPDLLIRTRRTASLDRKSASARFAELDNTMRVHPKRRVLIQDRPVLLVDDVMTSGATFAEATHSCQQAGSGDVFVLALARVAKDA